MIRIMLGEADVPSAGGSAAVASSEISNSRQIPWMMNIDRCLMFIWISRLVFCPQV